MIEYLDNTILDWFVSLQNPVLTPFMKFITWIGEGGMVWIVIAGIFLLMKKTRGIGIAMLLAMLLGLILGNGILKNVVARPRPCWVNPEVPMLIAVPTDYSFPSGHTLSSFSAATAIWWGNKKWGAIALAGAALMAFTRLYFYVHYPTDILGGLLLGLLLGSFSAWIVKKSKWGGSYAGSKEH